jgi:hypothetical protein
MCHNPYVFPTTMNPTHNHHQLEQLLFTVTGNATTCDGQRHAVVGNMPTGDAVVGNAKHDDR